MVHRSLGWWVLKIFHRSESCILWDKVDIYGRLLEPKNWGPYFTELRALWPSRPINKAKNHWPQNAPKMKFYFEIHISIAHYWQPFENFLVKMFVKDILKLVPSFHCNSYAAKQEGLAPLILWSKVVDFFGSKASYICVLYPTGCKIRSDEIFFKPTTLMGHGQMFRAR